MKGTIKDESFRQSGACRYELKSRCMPRLGPSENFYIPVAPGPRASMDFKNSVRVPFSNLIKKVVSRTISAPGFFVLVCMLLFSNVKVQAVPVLETEVEFDLPCIDNFTNGIDSYAYDSILARYPWWINSGFSDAANVEWIPAQEFQYKAIESILYNFLGGTYEPGSIGHPFRTDFKYLIVVQAEDNEDVQCADSIAKSPGTQSSSDIIEPGLFSTDQYTLTETGRQEPARFNISEVPEPSSVFLFTIAAFGYLWMKNKNG